MEIRHVYSNIIFKKIWLFLLGTITLLLANLAASSIYDSVDIKISGVDTCPSYLRIGYIVLFFIFAYFLYIKIPRFRPQTRRLSNERPAEYRNHLILFLSKLPDVSIKDNTCIPDWLTPNIQYKMDEDIKAMEMGRWQWEMPLRAINHQRRGNLKSIILVCSDNQEEPDGSLRKGSLAQVHHFVNLLRKYDELNCTEIFLLVKNKDGEFLKYTPSIPMEENREYIGLGFEVFDELTSGLWWLIEKHGYQDGQIMIDITGGQKPTSVAGAALTFNRKIKAQYVQTESRKDVISYDVEFVSIDELKV
ncbi:MAG: hypothetical protein HY879_11680 [Deltaproteobacteria bacterium]|nr:hypothetical protein [Deltaproteobacteria bacterium]